MGGIRPDFDPVAALAKARARLDAAKAATARASFEPLAPLGGSDPALAAAMAQPIPQSRAPKAPTLEDIFPATPRPKPAKHYPSVRDQAAAKDEAARQAAASLPFTSVGPLAGLTSGQVEELTNIPRAIPGGTAMGVTSMTGTGGTRAGHWLVDQARRVEGPEGLGTTVGRVGANLAVGYGLYRPILGAMSLAPEGSALARLGGALESPDLLKRIGAQVATGVPLDALAAASEAEDSGDFFKPLARNLAYNVGGTALFEGVRQAFMPTTPRTVNAQQAADIANAPPPRVQRPSTQGVDAKGPIYENPDPIAEARAANPLTDTDPDRILARARERTANPLPPEAYAGPERRLASVTPDDILNRHRRAADLPPTAGAPPPVKPTVGGTTPAGMPVARLDFTEPSMTVRQHEAELERLAMQERSAASELAARELGEPPPMEGAPPILPSTGRGGKRVYVGGNPKYKGRQTADLMDYQAELTRRIEESARTMGDKVKVWTRYDDDISAQRSGTSFPREAGRAKAAGNRDARVLAEVEEELHRRGVSGDEMLAHTQAVQADLEAAAEARRAVKPAKRVVESDAPATERFPDEWDESGDIAPRPKGTGRRRTILPPNEQMAAARQYIINELAQRSPEERGLLEALPMEDLADLAKNEGIVPPTRRLGPDLSSERGALGVGPTASEGEYERALSRKDYRTAHRLAAEARGWAPKDWSYSRGGAHDAPSPNGGAPLHDLTGNGVYPDDVYGPNGLRYYGTGDDAMDVQAYNIVRSVEGHPNRGVRVYRAVDLDGKPIGPGDWVTTVRKYAVEHGESNMPDGYRIISKTVPARDLYTDGNSWLEFGYHPQDRYPRLMPSLGERGALGIPGGPGFKSRLVESVKATKWDKAPARTWISKLRGQQSSADEFDWALGDALRADPNKQWTRAEVLALAEQRGYGALTETTRRTIPVEERGIGADAGAEYSDDGAYIGTPAKFASYQEPGGTNYREVLLRVPEGERPPLTPNEENDMVRRGLTPQTYRRTDTFQSSHWDEPNVLAHIRMNDRVGPNGEKVLHVEEIQSDWHQKGRKEGYAGDEQWTVVHPLSRLEMGNFPSEAAAAKWAKSHPETSGREWAFKKVSGRIPHAPFKETPEWLGLSMKRVLDEAVAGGYDAVSWTPGVKQADRYSLRKVADEVWYMPENGYLRVLKDHHDVHTGTYDAKALPDVIGKEAADRLLGTPLQFGNGGKMHRLTGEQLEIGGEGMKAFYDQMVPDWVRGYAKKLGVRIEVGTAPILGAGGAGHRIDSDLLRESIDDIRSGYGGRERVSKADARLADALEGMMEGEQSLPRSAWKEAWWDIASDNNVPAPQTQHGWRILEGNLKEVGDGNTPFFRITPELRAAIGKGQNYGKGAVPIMGGITGAGVGGAVGYATGDTPEERRRNALLGALAGASIGSGIGYASERIGIRYAPQIRDWASRTYQGLLNDVHAADEFGRRVGQTEAVAQATATARGWRGRADWYIGKRGPATGGPLTLKQVMLSAKGIEPEVQALATYRHALELDAAGMADKGVDLALARQNIPLLEADPRVKAAADELHAFYRRLLDDRLANGLLDQSQYDAIIARGDYYVPFVREWSVEQRPRTTGGGRLFNRSSGVRRMNPQEVASSAIVNPFEQAVRDAQSTARDIGRQRVMNTVGDILTAHPNEAAPYLVDHGPMATTSPLHASLEDRVITPVIHGVKHRVEVTDPDLLASLQAQAPASESIFKKLLTVPKRLLQTGVTMHPEFGAANASRDAFFSSMQYHFPTASALTGTALGAGVGAATAEPGERTQGALIGAGIGLGAGVMAPHLWRTVQGLSHVLQYDDLYQEWLQAGGSGMGMYVKTPADAQRLVRRLTKQHGPLDILNPKSWWDGLQFVNEAIEQAPRVARFADELGKGASPTAAAASSRDISVDFSRRGADPGVRAAADVTAFWNPNIQGLDKVRRTLFSKNSAKAWAMGAATMTAPSLALFAINKDDPAYWDRPLWERNLFWLVPAGQLENGETRFIRVPKPFEPGYIFASIPERLAEFAYQRDPERTAAALRDMVGNTLGAFVPIPTAIKPVAEAAVNYDTFRRRPVVPQGLENLPASRQVLPQTSVAARAAGAIGEAVGVPISPLKVDHVIRGLTGPLGAGALEAVADPVARLVGLDRGPQPPARPLVEWSRFVTKPNGFGTDDVQTMFRRFDRAEQWHTDITRRAKAGDPTVGDVVRAHREDLLLYTQLKPFVSAFRDLSAARRAVTASRTMSPEEKRAALLQLGEYAAELATKAVNGMSGQVPRRVPTPGADQPTTIPLGGR